jgi:hypothetical protein
MQQTIAFLSPEDNVLCAWRYGPWRRRFAEDLCLLQHAAHGAVNLFFRLLRPLLLCNLCLLERVQLSNAASASASFVSLL